MNRRRFCTYTAIALPLVLAATLRVALCASLPAAETQKVEANRVIEIALTSQKNYDAPFSEWNSMPLSRNRRKATARAGFWPEPRWCFRFATDKPGGSSGGRSAPMCPTLGSTASRGNLW